MTVTSASGPVVVTGLDPSRAHTITLTKLNEGSYGTAIFESFLIGESGVFLAPSAARARRIEVIGDGTSNGYGVLNSGSYCEGNALNEDATVSFGAIAADILGADVSIIASHGFGMYEGHQGSTTDALPNIYEDAAWDLSKVQWNFSSDTVDAVVIRLGDNDYHASGGGDSSDFIAAYTSFLKTVRSQRPSALILCAYGPFRESGAQQWITDAVKQVVSTRKQAGDSAIQVADLNTGHYDTASRYGMSCSSYMNQAVHSIMAMRLVSYLETGKGWW